MQTDRDASENADSTKDSSSRIRSPRPYTSGSIDATHTGRSSHHSEIPSNRTGVADSPWNSLEVTKLVATLIIALIGGLYTWITYEQKRDDDSKAMMDAANVQRRMLEEEQVRRVARARSAIWAEVAPQLNDMYAYFLFVGDFKNLNPQEILADKRNTDRIMWSNRGLFDKKAFDAYTAFINSTFQPYQGWLKDAALRTVPIRPNDSGFNDAGFTKEDNRRCINQTYWLLQKATAESLGMPDPGIPAIRDPDVQLARLGTPNSDTCPSQ